MTVFADRPFAECARKVMATYSVPYQAIKYEDATVFKFALECRNVPAITAHLRVDETGKCELSSCLAKYIPSAKKDAVNQLIDTFCENSPHACVEVHESDVVAKSTFYVPDAGENGFIRVFFAGTHFQRTIDKFIPDLLKALQ